jgi:hypothetical protein
MEVHIIRFQYFDYSAFMISFLKISYKRVQPQSPVIKPIQWLPPVSVNFLKPRWSMKETIKLN